MKYLSIFLLVALTGALPARADLPMMKDKPWLGYFVGFKDRGASFGVSSKGNTLFKPLKRDGTPIASTNPIKVKFDIIETLPSGKTIRKKIDPDAFTSDSPASLDPKQPVTFRGIVTGDAKFEITVSEERGAVCLSGRITDKGSLKNPLHLAISIDFLPYKSSDVETEEQQKKVQEKSPPATRSVSISASSSAASWTSSTPMNPAKKVRTASSPPKSALKATAASAGTSPPRRIPSSASRTRASDPSIKVFLSTGPSTRGADPTAEKFSIKHHLVHRQI